MGATLIPTPAAGDVVLSSWGAAVAAAHNGIQSGVANVSLASSALGTAAVVFPRPFVGIPVVVAVNGGSSAYFALVSGITATGFNAALAHRDGTATTGGPYQVLWIAIGVPA